MIVQIQKFKGLILSFILSATLAATGFFVSAQEIPNNIPRYNPTKPAATPPPRPTSKPYIWDKEKEKSKTKKRILNESDTPAEKSLAVDTKVNVSFCVSEGTVRVNGWDRNEIRAYVSDGSKVGFKVLQRSKQTESPIWVKILGFDPSTTKEADAEECLSGSEIEIDVPRNATVNIEGIEINTTVESVRKVSVHIAGGNISLNDIAQGIEAVTYQGGITVGRSDGAVDLITTDGNIVAYEVSPSEVGDIFKAKTNKGMIMLDQIEHGQIDISSNTGSIRFNGAFSSNGQYSFGTQSGSILLTIPEKSSCTIYAILAYGQFNSEIPLVTENISNPNGVKSLTGVIGKGEAKLNLKTYNGKIMIKKQ